jgi:tetratricopeptide (TPR) repeat protein
MKKICLAALAVFAFICALMSPVQAQTLQETLTQYISDLQRNPGDNTLREKIIKFVQTMKPVPKTPEEVDELVGQAKYVFKHAKTQEDYLGAVEAYKKIVNITPWVGDYYYNLGVAQEQAGQPNDAINSFKLYLLASPDAQDAKEIRERIGGLKYAIEKAAKETSPTAIAAKKQNDYEEWLRKIDGRRYTHSAGYKLEVIDVRGRFLVLGDIIDSYKEWTAEGSHVAIQGRETTVDQIHQESIHGTMSYTFIISEDGQKIVWRIRFSNGNVQEAIFLWQR